MLKNCPKCKNECNDEWTFCPKCTAKLTGGWRHAMQTEKPAQFVYRAVEGDLVKVSNTLQNTGKVSTKKIIYWGAGLFFLLFPLLINHPIAVTLTLLLSFGGRWLYKSHKIKSAEEKRIAQENSIAQLGVEIKPILAKYVNSHSISWTTWPPATIIIPDSDIKALKLIIENELHKDVPENVVRFFANEEMTIKAREKFSDEFSKIHFKLSPNLDLEKAILTYCKIFNNNTERISYIKQYLEQHNIHVPPSILKDKINQCCQQLAIELQAEKLKRAIEAGEAIRNNITIDIIDNMDGIKFEHFLGKLFTNMGYTATVTKASGDQGADLIIEKHGTKTAVQAKRYTGAVSNSSVQQAASAKLHYGCQEAMVVTNSQFTHSAKELAASTSVILIDRSKLTELLRDFPVINYEFYQ